MALLAVGSGKSSNEKGDLYIRTANTTLWNPGLFLWSPKPRPGGRRLCVAKTRLKTKVDVAERGLQILLLQEYNLDSSSVRIRLAIRG